MKRSYLIGLLLGLAACPGAMADAPEGYYSACEGKTQRALKSQLYSMLKNHTAVPYGSGSNSTWWAFHFTDVDESDNTWYDIYTTKRVAVTGDSEAGAGMNIEHTFPKSWWGGTKNDAYKDIGHLMPSESKSNSTRGNYPYAEVETVRDNPESYMTFKRGTPKSGQGGNASMVIEPSDEYKGDLARNYFYMVTCYQDLTWSSDGLNTAAQGDYPTLQPWAQEMLLRWHRDDPVSDKERKRNDGLYQVQNNRNPFIDHPEMVEHIWGDLQETLWYENSSPIDPPTTDEPVLTSPVAGEVYHFGNVALGESATVTIPILGSGFTHSITLSISGRDADMFRFVVASTEFSGLTILPADINNESGYYLTLRYTPSSFTPEGTCHEAVIELKSKDIEGESFTVTAQGTCPEPVELVPPVALDPENLTATSYTARWIASTSPLDGYLLYRNIYSPDGSTVAETITYDVEADQVSFEITDRDSSVNESYWLVALWGGQTSEPSNVITVAALDAIDEIGLGLQPSGAEYFTVDGVALPGEPSQPGVYVVRRGNLILKTVRVK